MEGKAYFCLSQCYNVFRSKERGVFKMVIKKSRHAPRSVCDTERDRRQCVDPLKEEEV
jgi:hypothetical protein